MATIGTAGFLVFIGAALKLVIAMYGWPMALLSLASIGVGFTCIGALIDLRRSRVKALLTTIEIRHGIDLTAEKKYAEDI